MWRSDQNYIIFKMSQIEERDKHDFWFCLAFFGLCRLVSRSYSKIHLPFPVVPFVDTQWSPDTLAFAVHSDHHLAVLALFLRKLPLNLLCQSKTRVQVKVLSSYTCWSISRSCDCVLPNLWKKKKKFRFIYSSVSIVRSSAERPEKEEV